LTFSLTRLIRWRICFAVLLITSVMAQAFAQDKPRLRDFGSSLKKDSRKNKDEPRNSKQNSGESDEVIRVRTDLVVCDVMVVNNRGDAIPGLERSDFVVREDGNPQAIGTFSLGADSEIPRTIVLIIDYSGSELPYIKTSIDAAKILVDKLGPKDRMALVTDDVELLVDFTPDKALLKDKLESLKKRSLSGKLGKSLQYTALMATLNEMFNGEELRPIIILQTDGDQLTFLKDFSFEDVYAAVERSRATIYTIVPGYSLIGRSAADLIEQARAHQPRQHKEQLAIGSLAKLSGGWIDFLEKPGQADEVYARLLADIDNRYVIGYYPTNKLRDGKQRKIKIEVRGHPKYIVWGRHTYFAPAE
jgi:VWFA-related protein